VKAASIGQIASRALIVICRLLRALAVTLIVGASGPLVGHLELFLLVEGTRVHSFYILALLDVGGLLLHLLAQLAICLLGP
jgi:hypothetical protein